MNQPEPSLAVTASSGGIAATSSSHDTSFVSRTTVVTREHINFLDGMRGMAALYVAMSHVWIMPATSVSHRLIRLFFEGGHTAVSVFIVLSGYCLMLPYVNGRNIDVKEFFLFRALRILPPYYLALIVSLLLAGTLIPNSTDTMWRAAVPITGESVLAHLFMIQDWFRSTSGKIDYVMWSVGVEWKIYFLFPLMLGLGRRFGFFKLAVWANVLSFAVWGILFAKNWLNPEAEGSAVYYIGLFASGMATAVWLRTLQKQQLDKAFFQKLAAAIALLLIVVYVVEFKKHGQLQLGSFPSGVLACLGIAWMTLRQRSMLSSWFSSPLLVELGRISFSLYLIHPPVQQLVWAFVIKRYFSNSPFEMPIAYALCAAASLIAAFLFYWLIEARSLTWIRTIKQKRREVANDARRAPTVSA
jgi:peptidoglycan/LPS O-acetylase OafA/YrhL